MTVQLCYEARCGNITLLPPPRKNTETTMLRPGGIRNNPNQVDFQTLIMQLLTRILESLLNRRYLDFNVSHVPLDGTQPEFPEHHGLSAQNRSSESSLYVRVKVADCIAAVIRKPDSRT
jgi:hypothetical protein